MKKYVGPVHYSTRDYQTKAHTYQVSDVVSPIMQTVAAGISIKQQHDKQMEINRQQQAAMNQYAQDQLDSFAMQKIAEDNRRLQEDQIREERNRRFNEDMDRMEATQREMDFNDQFRMLEEDQKIGNILNREAKRDRDIESRIERSINDPIDEYMRDMDAYNRQMRRNEEEIANKAFAQMKENSKTTTSSNTPVKRTMSQMEKDAISMLENLGYDKSTATNRVASTYTEGMSEDELYRTLLRG